MNLSQLLTHSIDINGRPTLHSHPVDGGIRATTKISNRPLIATGAELLERMAIAQRLIASLTQGVENTQAILDEALRTTAPAPMLPPIAALPKIEPDLLPPSVIAVSSDGQRLFFDDLTYASDAPPRTFDVIIHPFSPL